MFIPKRRNQNQILKFFSRISIFYGRGCADCCHLGCETVRFGRQLSTGLYGATSVKKVTFTQLRADFLPCQGRSEGNVGR
jgi:hypothetical protein